MALLLKFFLAYGLAFTVGFVVMRMLDHSQRFSRGFICFCALPVGIGFLTMQVFTVGIFGANLTLPVLLAIAGADLALLLAAAMLLGRPVFSFTTRTVPFQGSKVLLIVFLIVLAFKIGAGVWQIASTPVYEFDSWNNWDLRGKVIFDEHRLPLDKSQPYYLGGGLSSYPLNDGLWKVWVATMVGSWREDAVNLYSVAFYAVLVGLFYFSLPRDWSPNFRLIPIYALTGLPFIYFHSWMAYADLEFTVYAFLAIISLFRFIIDSYKPYLYLSAIALALAVWTKNEGLALLAPVIFFGSIWQAYQKTLSKKHFITYWLTASAFAAPWLIFRFVNKLNVLSGDSSTFKFIINDIFFVDWLSSIFLRSHFNFLWLLLIILIVYFRQVIWQEQALRFLALTTGLFFLASSGVILFTDRAYDLSAAVRSNMQIVPVALYLCAFLLERLWYRK